MADRRSQGSRETRETNGNNASSSPDRGSNSARRAALRFTGIDPDRWGSQENQISPRDQFRSGMLSEVRTRDIDQARTVWSNRINQRFSEDERVAEIEYMYEHLSQRFRADLASETEDLNIYQMRDHWTGTIQEQFPMHERAAEIEFMNQHLADTFYQGTLPNVGRQGMDTIINNLRRDHQENQGDRARNCILQRCMDRLLEMDNNGNTDGIREELAHIYGYSESFALRQQPEMKLPVQYMDLCEECFKRPSEVKIKLEEKYFALPHNWRRRVTEVQAVEVRKIQLDVHIGTIPPWMKKEGEPFSEEEMHPPSFSKQNWLKEVKDA